MYQLHFGADAHSQTKEREKKKTANPWQRWLKWNLMMIGWFGENFMQIQARCNSATAPSTKQRRENKISLFLNEGFKKKKHPVVNLYNENTFGIYI